MVRFKNYVKAGSLSEAYELNQKKSSIVGGGMMWLKLQNRVKMTLIDLSGLGLDTIEETDEEFRIGCMCTLRMLETHEGLNTYFGRSVSEWGDGRRQCVRKIWFFRYHDLPDGARYLCGTLSGRSRLPERV